MARQKRKRSDSIEVRTQMMKEAINGIEPPPHINLEKAARPFWDTIIAARTDWTNIDLQNAAVLARVQYTIDQQSKLLLSEGAMQTNSAGTGVPNPRINVLKALALVNMQYSVKMQVHSHATVGPLEDQVNKNKKKKQILDSIEILEDEDELYLAKPN